MKRINYIALLCCLFVGHSLIYAQTNTDKINKTNNEVKGTVDAVQSSVQTIENIKGIFKDGKGKAAAGGPCVMLIENIGYDDNNLSTLKDAIRNTKGVKGLTMDYKSGNASLSVLYKGSPIDLWDQLSLAAKQNFKVLETKDNTLLLQYKLSVKKVNSISESVVAEVVDQNITAEQANQKSFATGEAEYKATAIRDQGIISNTNDKKVSEVSGNNKKTTLAVDKQAEVKKSAGIKPSKTVQPNKSENTGTLTDKPVTGGGNIDIKFNNPALQFDDSSRFDGDVNAIVLQPDGKILAGGNFNYYNKFRTPGLIRMFADGSIDKTFAVATGFNGAVNAIALQKDGKVIVGGGFSNYNGPGVPVGKIARLNIDGSIDRTFNTGTGFIFEVLALSIQPDGKILVGCYGNNKFNGTPLAGLVRLNTDGSLDNSFDYSKGIRGSVYCINLMPNGKIFAGGKFAVFDKIKSGSIVKLNNDGSFDNSFTVDVGFAGVVQSILPLSNGKILIGGDFHRFNKINCHNLLRLNSDGSYDNTYNDFKVPTLNYAGMSVDKLLQLQDGKIIMCGDFREYNSNKVFSILRMSADGTYDPSFTTGLGFDMRGYGGATVKAIAVRNDGSFVTGGRFKRYNGILRNSIASIDKNGNIQPYFNILKGFDRQVEAIAVQKDGKILAGGSFVTYNGSTKKSLVRINVDGTVDNTFNVIDDGFADNDQVKTIALQADGKILAGGAFRNYAKIARNGLVRVNSNGSLDESFYVGNGFDNAVSNVVLQRDGKVLVGGSFRYYDGIPSSALVRLQADGRRDESFQVGEYFSSGVTDIVIQDDGKIIVVGINMYRQAYGVNSTIVRLNTDGSRDNTFKQDQVIQDLRASAAYLSRSGKILVAGKSKINNEDGQRIISLNLDGSLDKSFNSQVIFNGDINALAVQADGKIIVVGQFSQTNKSLAAKKIVRLNSDGTFDNSFVTGAGIEKAEVNAVAFQPDGRVVIGGSFEKFNGYTVNRITRLETNN